MTTAQKQRLNFIFFFFVMCYGLIIATLYTLQVSHGSLLHALPDNMHKRNTLVYERAEIVDRNGKTLALTVPSLSAFIIPSKLSDASLLKISTFLAEHFPRAYKQLMQSREALAHTQFMYVKRHIDEKDRSCISQSLFNEIKYVPEKKRFYPVESVGPVIGITDSDNHGISGIEKAYDDLLTGQKDTHPSPVRLTIDASLQFLAFEEIKAAANKLKAQEAAALIMDPTTGDILAMAQYPNFDPNRPLENNDVERSKNKLLTDTYELGSVIKIFLALAALEENSVNSDEIIDCENTKSTTIKGFKVNTLKPHGLLTFSQVIELSNNIGTSKVAQRIGPALYKHYRRCGFGKKTGIEVPGEQKGFVNPPERWSKLSIFSLSFGYEIRATLLQLARAFSLVALKGAMVTPRLILSPEAQKTTFSQTLYSQKTVDTLRAILHKTITRGTAQRARINGYTILGKTGTANLLVDGVYQPSHNIFTFIGLIEKDAYKRIVVTFIKETEKKEATAASTAVPLFEKIAQKMLIHEKIL